MKEIDELILKLIETLKLEGRIQYDTDFCSAIGLKKQNLTRIKKGAAHFTVYHIHMICKQYKVNPAYLLLLSRNQKSTDNPNRQPKF